LWADTVQLGNSLWFDLRTIAAKVWWLHASVLQSIALIRGWTARSFNAAKMYAQKFTRRDVVMSPLNTGSQASVVVTSPALVQPLSQSTASSFEPQYHELVSDVEAKINAELPALASKSGKSQDDALRYLLMDQYSALILERVSRFLYGIQIDSLIFLNSNNYSSTLDEIKRFYDMGSAKFPEIYKNYPFEKWLGFLEMNGIVGVSDNIITATPIGKALIPYMEMRRYLLTKAPGRP
jgi:hypothetical protein